MATGRITAFVEYVLTGIYRDRKSQKKKLLAIGRSELTDIVGGQRLGVAQKNELRDACRRQNIGLAELPDQFLFFDPEGISELTADLNGLKGELKKLAGHFAKLYGSTAADEEWEKQQFPSLN